MSTGIVFYSRSNNTRFIAEQLAKRTGATIVEIKEKGSREGIVGFLSGGFGAATKRSSQLAGQPWEEIGAFTSLYLLSPIWAGNGCPAMNAFLDKADFTGKRVTIVTLQADPKGAESDKVHSHFKSRIEEKGGTVIGRIALHSAPPGKFAGEEHLAQQLIKIPQK